jgi:hypothetical protein
VAHSVTLKVDNHSTARDTISNAHFLLLVITVYRVAFVLLGNCTTFFIFGIVAHSETLKVDNQSAVRYIERAYSSQPSGVWSVR